MPMVLLCAKLTLTWRSFGASSDFAGALGCTTKFGTRLRLGKALNYEFNEDSQTGLFQRRDPREGMHVS